MGIDTNAGFFGSLFSKNVRQNVTNEEEKNEKEVNHISDPGFL
jgi:hypothetical protein